MPFKKKKNPAFAAQELSKTLPKTNLLLISSQNPFVLAFIIISSGVSAPSQ